MNKEFLEWLENVSIVKETQITDLDGRVYGVEKSVNSNIIEDIKQKYHETHASKSLEELEINFFTYDDMYWFSKLDIENDYKFEIVFDFVNGLYTESGYASIFELQAILNKINELEGCDDI